jgi:hypothetical protein
MSFEEWEKAVPETFRASLLVYIAPVADRENRHLFHLVIYCI